MTNATSDGHIVTNYYPYTTNQNSITISDSTIFFNFNFKMPSDTDSFYNSYTKGQSFHVRLWNKTYLSKNGR